MSTQDVKCPICGCINKGFYLDETSGWMECIKCKTAVQVAPERYVKRIPVIQMNKPIPNEVLDIIMRRNYHE